MSLPVDTIRSRLTVFSVFFLIIFFVYGNVISHPFMLEDEKIFGFWARPLSPDSFLSCFDPGVRHIIYFRPIVSLFNLLLFNLSSGDVIIYRVVSFFLYAIFLTLMYAFTSRLFRSTLAAGITVMLYCIHPINGFYVWHVSASANLLLGCFMVTVLLTHLVYLDRKLRYWFWCSCAFTVFALATHEMAATLVWYVFLIDIYRSRSLPASLKRTLIYVFIIGLWQILRLSIMPSTVGFYNLFQEGFSTLGLSFSNYIPSLAILVSWYLLQLFWPSQLLFIKTIKPIQENLFLFNVFIIIFLLTLIIALILMKRQRIRFLTAWFAAGLAPLLVAALIYPFDGLTIEPHWFMVGVLPFFWALSRAIINLKETMV